MIENNASLEGPVVPVKTTSALTSYAESAPSIDSNDTTTDDKLDVISNPYESQDLKKVLSRSYLVYVALFTHTHSSGDNLVTLKFPTALQNIENIMDKLAQFQYLKADVDIEIRINATQFHIGSLNVSWISHADETTQPSVNSPNYRLNKNSTIMSLSSINAVKVRIPRTGPRLWDLASPGVGLDGPEIGTLYIDVLDKITTLSGTAASDLQISVFANFVNPRVAGYGVSEVVPAMLKRKMRRLTLQEVRSKDNVKKSLEEGKEKSQKGLISGVAEAAGSFAPLLAATPFAEFAPLAGLAGQFAPFLASLGLCKPNDVSSVQQIVERPLQDMTHCHGLSMAVKLTDHPDATLADTDVSELKRNKIRDIIMKPCHILKSIINSSTIADATFLHFPVHPGLSKFDGVTTYYPSYLAYISQLFGKWRGGIKILIKFITSQFTTARVRILHLPNENLPASIEGFAGDVPNTVVDIRGNTDFSFTLPYLSAFPYLPVGGYMGPQQSAGFSQAFPWPSTWLSMSLVSPVNIPDPTGDSTIHYHVYISAAEDFQFADLRGKTFYPTGYTAPPLQQRKVVQTKEKVIEKKSMDVLFAKPFPGLIPVKATREVAMVAPEFVTTVEEILKRPRKDLAFNSAQLLLFGELHLNLLSGVSTTAHLIRLFQFYRGAIRYKIIPSDTKILTLLEYNPASGSLPATYAPTDTMAATSVNPAWEVEVPWNDLSYLREVTGSGTGQDALAFTTNGVALPVATNSNNIYLSVGEDFMLGGLLSPPSYDPTSLDEKTDLSESVSSKQFIDLMNVND